MLRTAQPSCHFTCLFVYLIQFTSKTTTPVNSVILFDQFVMSNTESNLQKAACKLHPIITELGLTISVQKTKLMSFKRRDPVRSRMLKFNQIMEQGISFSYSGNLISYEKNSKFLDLRPTTPKHEIFYHFKTFVNVTCFQQYFSRANTSNSKISIEIKRLQATLWYNAQIRYNSI